MSKCVSSIAHYDLIVTGILFNLFKDQKPKKLKTRRLRFPTTAMCNDRNSFTTHSTPTNHHQCILFRENASKARFRVYTWTKVIKQIILLNNKNNQAPVQTTAARLTSVCHATAVAVRINTSHFYIVIIVYIMNVSPDTTS